eukprot:278687-Pleurochrysis_carterae.AAC.2
MSSTVPKSVEGDIGMRKAAPVLQNFVGFAQHKRIMENETRHGHAKDVKHVKQQSQCASPSDPAKRAREGEGRREGREEQRPLPSIKRNNIRFAVLLADRATTSFSCIIYSSAEQAF